MAFIAYRNVEPKVGVYMFCVFKEMNVSAAFILAGGNCHN
jgi:hypothetical protein